MVTRKFRPTLVLALASLLWFSAVPSFAQAGNNPGPAADHDHPPMEHHHHGRWWDNPHLAQKVGLSDAQKQQMDQIFEKHRPQLKALNATLKKDEAALHPMLSADKLDEHKVLHQIDTIAQARANLEKANARMLFGMRKVLTPEQWKKLQELAREWHERHHGQDHHGPDDGAPPPKQ
ncbi:MAG: Spy/CpxP family protein refolding chaperone [Acidobacteriaceae bacterium]